MPTAIVFVGLATVVLLNLSIGLFGYRVAMKHTKRMAQIDPPERCQMFQKELEGQADQPLTAEDIDRIDDWDDE